MSEDLFSPTPPSVGKPWSIEDIKAHLIATPAYNKALDLIQEYFIQRPSRSVLLVGESGVGKSTLIHLLAQRLSEEDWLIKVADAADLMAGQRYIGDLEQQLKNLIQEVSAIEKSLWIVPRFHELYYSGRHDFSPIGILDQVMPHLESGNIRLIGEILPQHFEKIVQFRPQIRNAMEIIRIDPPDQDDAVELARSWCEQGSPDQQLWQKVDQELLQEICQLTDQYIHNKVYPGKLLDFLKFTQHHKEALHEQDQSIGYKDFISSISILTGIPSSILDDQEKLDLEALKRQFQSRVLGQDEAVNTLVERVALIKAGLTDPSRPMGVFLFVGPTGTGKTEIAKAITSFLFGTEDRLIRLDMSEFQTPTTIERLIGNPLDTSESTALVNQVRKNPFSVILLDEFEKAHPNIWDMFLQVFDDGRLTDARGDMADFRHSIIIMTSNVGASYRPPRPRSTVGFIPAEEEVNIKEKELLDQALFNTFRPEFLNRIDRIVRFRPLSRAVLRKILKIELQRVLNRRGLRQRKWEVEWDDSAIEFLLEKGYNSQLGARPMKRAIEQYLLAPLAITIVNHQFPEGNQFLFVSEKDRQLKVDFIDPDEPYLHWKEKEERIHNQIEKAEKLSIAKVALSAQGILAEKQVLLQCFENINKKKEQGEWEIQKANLLDEMNEPDFWSQDDRYEVLNEIEFRDRFDAGLETASSLLERLEDPTGKTRLQFPEDIIQRIAERLWILEHALDSFQQHQAQDAFLKLWIEADERNELSDWFAEKLEGMYKKWAEKRGMKFILLHKETDIDYEVRIAISGFGAWALLRSETGIHSWSNTKERNKQRPSRGRVRVLSLPQPEPFPLDKELKQVAHETFEAEGISKMEVIRKYQQKPTPLVTDKKGSWRSGKVDKIFSGDFDLIKG